ncbi:ABC transporter permease [Streptomyces sp. NPDC002643]
MSTTTARTAQAPTPQTSSASAPRPASPTRSLVRAMIRPHQSALWFWGLLVLLTGGGLLWAAGPGVDAAWDEVVRSGCLKTDYCELSGPGYNLFGTAVSLGTFVLAILPFLVAAWAGGALIAREFDSGTVKLAWTQSVTPARWLAAKLAVPAAALVTGTVLLTLLNRLVWARDTEIRHNMATRDWFDSATFEANGTTATAYALLGLAVGVLAGLLFHRVLPALCAGLLGVMAAAGTISGNRHLLWPTETVISRTERGDWTGEMVDRGIVTTTGDHISSVACTADDACGRTDIAAYYTEYHPSSHFWPLQLVETGIVLTLTALLILAAFAVLRRQTPLSASGTNAAGGSTDLSGGSTDLSGSGADLSGGTR